MIQRRNREEFAGVPSENDGAEEAEPGQAHRALRAMQGGVDSDGIQCRLEKALTCRWHRPGCAEVQLGDTAARKAGMAEA